VNGPGKPRRVLLVETNEDGTVGGSHQCLYDLVSRLDRRLWEPVALFYQHNRFVDRVRAEGVATHVWEEQRRIERARRADAGALRKLETAAALPGAVLRRARFLRAERIDHVHLNNSPCAGFDEWIPAARIARRPISAHARGMFVDPGATWRWLARRFDAVVAISRGVAESFAGAGFERERIRQVYDGVDLSRWTPRPGEEGARLRAEHGVGADDLLVVLVGHLRRWKGQHVALHALAALDRDVRARVRLWIVGDAPRGEEAYADELHQFVRDHGLGDAVSFLGYRSDVAQLMGAADVVLHTSTTPEPFGLVVVEALALGRAVVASRLGGPAEILESGDGVLFDPADPGELGRVLSELARSRERREELGRRARARAREFDVQRTVAGVTSVWEDLARGRA
jgi:glycosyltransferase involved in cell wall biosynthesis